MIEAESLECNELYLLFRSNYKQVVNAYSACKDSVLQFRNLQKKSLKHGLLKTDSQGVGDQNVDGGKKEDGNRNRSRSRSSLHRNFRVDLDGKNDQSLAQVKLKAQTAHGSETPPCSVVAAKRRLSGKGFARIVDENGLNSKSKTNTSGMEKNEEADFDYIDPDICVSSTDGQTHATHDSVGSTLESINESSSTRTNTEENTLILCVPQALSFRSKQTVDDVYTHVLVPWNEAKGAFVTLGGKSEIQTCSCLSESCFCCCCNDRAGSCLVSQTCGSCSGYSGKKWSENDVKRLVSGNHSNRRVLVKGSRIHTLSGFKHKRVVRIMFTEDLILDAEGIREPGYERKVRILHIDRPLEGGSDAPCTIEEMTGEQVTRYITLLKCLPENQPCFQQLEAFINKVRKLGKTHKCKSACFETKRTQQERNQGYYEEDNSIFVHDMECIEKADQYLDDVEVHMKSWILSCTDSLFQSSAFDALRSDPVLSTQIRRHKLQVQQALESYVTTELYSVLVRWLRIINSRRDLSVNHVLRSLAGKGFTQQSLKMKPEFQCPQNNAVFELLKLACGTRMNKLNHSKYTSLKRAVSNVNDSKRTCTTPLEKLLCMERVIMAINDAVENNLTTHYLQIGSFQLTTDDLLDQIVFVLVTSMNTCPTESLHLCSMIQFVRRFHLRNVNTTSLGYILANFEVAVEWLLSKASADDITFPELGNGQDSRERVKAPSLTDNKDFLIHHSENTPKKQQRILALKLKKNTCSYSNDKSLEETEAININRMTGNAMDYLRSESANSILIIDDIKYVNSSKFRKHMLCWIMTNGRVRVSTGVHHAVFARKKFRMVSCGESHTLALTMSGNLYGWGNNRNGQVGVGESLKRCSSPFVIDFSCEGKNKNVFVSDLTCGSSHSMALTTNGDVWTWGRGKCGRLGHGATSNEYFPRMIIPGSFCNSRIVRISAGWSHSLAVAESGKVYSWGCGGEGRLGLNSFSDRYSPTLIASLTNHAIVKVAAGFAHTCMLSNRGEVFVCGHGGFGQLGLGDSMLSEAVLVELEQFRTTHKEKHEREQSEHDDGELGGNMAYKLISGLKNTFVRAVGRDVSTGDAEQKLPKAKPNNLKVDVSLCQDPGERKHNQPPESWGAELETPRRNPLKVKHLKDGVLPLSFESMGAESAEDLDDHEVIIDESFFVSRVNGTMCLKPVLLRSGLEETVVVDLDCGKHHCVVVGDLGNVFTWGMNNLGQCGTFPPTVCKPFQVGSLIKSGAVSHVVCGESETYVCFHQESVFV